MECSNNVSNAWCLIHIRLSNVALRTNDFDSDAIAANFLVTKEVILNSFRSGREIRKAPNQLGIRKE